jgi:hypothetical protein
MNIIIWLIFIFVALRITYLKFGNTPSSKKEFICGNVNCPSISVNYLTYGGLCQDCAWEEIEDSKKNTIFHIRLVH